MTPQTTSPFFRASCGCIGLQIGSTEHWQVVCVCDAENPEPSLGFKGQRKYEIDATYIPLSAEETAALLDNINKLIFYGHDMLEISHKLKHAETFRFKPLNAK